MLSPVTAADGWLGSTDNVYHEFSSLNLSATGENNPGLSSPRTFGSSCSRSRVFWACLDNDTAGTLGFFGLDPGRRVIVDPVTNLDASHGSPRWKPLTPVLPPCDLES